MKVFRHAIITLAIIAIFGLCQTSFAQAPTMIVTVTPSDVPIPLTVVRGTLVLFQGPISRQMTMTTFALRNDYTEFARGDFLDSWKLAWNTAVEHDPTEQIAVLWSRAGAPFKRLTRYNVKFVESNPFTLKADNANGKLSIVISPTGTMTAQKYTLSLDGAQTSLEIDGKGSRVIDISMFSPGSHTIGASAVMTDGSVTAIAPATFVVPVKSTLRKPAPATTKKRPASRAKPRRS